MLESHLEQYLFLELIFEIELSLKFTNVTHKVDIEARLDIHVIQKRRSFNYLGFIIQEARKIDEDVTYRICARRLKWRLVSRVLRDKKMSSVRTMLYGIKCCSVKNSHIQMKLSEIRMLNGCVSILKEIRLKIKIFEIRWEQL